MMRVFFLLFLIFFGVRKLKNQKEINEHPIRMILTLEPMVRC